MRKRAPTVEEWARAAGPRQGGKGCRACGTPQPARDDMETIARMRRRRTSRATAPATAKFINGKHGLALSVDIVRRHFTVCLQTPWGYLAGK